MREFLIKKKNRENVRELKTIFTQTKEKESKQKNREN